DEGREGRLRPEGDPQPRQGLLRPALRLDPAPPEDQGVGARRVRPLGDDRRAVTASPSRLSSAYLDRLAAPKGLGDLEPADRGGGDREIRRAIRRGAEDVGAIGLDCAAGTGCRSCWPDLRTLLDETRGPRPDAGHAGPLDPPAGDEPAGLSSPAVVVGSADPLVRAIVAVVRPIWRASGIRAGR